MIFTLILTTVLAQNVIAQEVFLQTGFEEFALGEPPQEWEVTGEGFEVTDDTVKTDKKSFAILTGANDDRVGIPIETDNPIISVEFWVYIEDGGRSFNIKIASADNTAENNGGVYINWNEGAVRLYDGAAWQEIRNFETDTWRYVRIVADVSKNEFDFYSGRDRNSALDARAESGLPFRNDAIAPTAMWAVFSVYSITTPGYVDDLLIYEGEEPFNLAVDPAGKIATTWGHIKRQ